MRKNFGALKGKGGTDEGRERFLENFGGGGTFWGHDGCRNLGEGRLERKRKGSRKIKNLHAMKGKITEGGTLGMR